MIALQLNPPIPMRTPKGKGLAQILLDYGIEHDLLWVVFLENGQCWTFQNRDIRADSNETVGRKSTEREKFTAYPADMIRGAHGT